MIRNKKTIFIIILILFFISLGINIYRAVPSEEQNYQNYKNGLAEYNDAKFSNCYHSFGKVSRFSKLKSAAIFRQALCAGKIDDTKTELKKFNEVIRIYPRSIIALRAKYLKGQNEFYSKKYKRAMRTFNNIEQNYSDSDYAIAANYYLGSIKSLKFDSLINNTKKMEMRNEAIHHFKTYLKTAPKGKFATSCIEKWTQLNSKLTNEDNLLIARTYQQNNLFEEANQYLNSTNMNVSWPYFVQNAYNEKKYSKVRLYTEIGLKNEGENPVSINTNFIDEKTRNSDIYKAIDLYLKVSEHPRAAISYLLGISKTADGQDYLMYKNCMNLHSKAQAACYNSLYYKYPNGQFAAESLANIFYDKIKKKKYFTAQKIGREHLAKFKDTKSAPRVMYWLGKISEKRKTYEGARSYYKSLLRQYPDDYYAYRAFLNLNRFKHQNNLEIKPQKIVFPYPKNSTLITELVAVKDYGLINQLYRDEKFIQSWLLYQQGNYSASATIARDAMDDFVIKPNRLDLRWRLVYPIHYWDEISKYANQYKNDPTLILGIIREESYFNPEAKSYVGARGLMQLMPSTAQEAASHISMTIPTNSFLYNPEINIRLGNIYYSRLKKALSNKDVLSILAYNGGMGTVSRWKSNIDHTDIDDFIEQIPYEETQNYVKKVYKSYWNYLRIYNGIKF